MPVITASPVAVQSANYYSVRDIHLYGNGDIVVLIDYGVQGVNGSLSGGGEKVVTLKPETAKALAVKKPDGTKSYRENIKADLYAACQKDGYIPAGTIS